MRRHVAESIGTSSGTTLKRCADVVGILPSEASIVRLIGAVLLEANDEWQMQHRSMGVEAMAELLNPSPTNEILQLPPKAAERWPPQGRQQSPPP